MRYTLWIYSKAGVYEHTLPAANNREVSVPLKGIGALDSLKLEVYDGIWMINNNGSDMCVGDDDHPIVQHIITDGDLIHCLRRTRDEFVVQVMEIDDSYVNFRILDITKEKQITIGRNVKSDIVIDNPMVSSEHAVLIKRGNVWTIKGKSKNDIYLNGQKVSENYALKMFDTLYTIGYKLVFLGSCIAVNRADVITTKLKEYNKPKMALKKPSGDENFFSRSPRSMETLYTETIEVEGTPAPQRQREQPMIFVIGPSVTMPLPILMATLINTQLNSGASSGRMYISTIASVAMSAMIAAGWALAHRKYNRKMLIADESFRKEAYSDYIDENRKLIVEKRALNERIMFEQYISSQKITEKILTDNSFVYNRNIHHDDFLTVRLGIGTVKFQAEIAVPKEKFSVYKDEMAKLPHELHDKYEYMDDNVVVFDLRKSPLIGMIGNKSMCDSVLNSILIQLTAFHSYNDVKLCVLCTENDLDRYRWARLLPHTFFSDMKRRMVAYEHESYANVLYEVETILRERREGAADSGEISGVMLPHYVIVCTSPEILEEEVVSGYYEDACRLGITFILNYGEMSYLPNQCHNIIEVSDRFKGVYDTEKTRSNLDRVKFDIADHIVTSEFSKQLSRLRLRDLGTGEIPDSVNYFDMLGIGRIEQWDLLRKYKTNRAYEGLKAFVGIGSGGKPFCIDIHQKKYGPHGLVAGTTGSGKSETLQTFILSLAMNYSPDEVAFLLIDYKGGGMANVFRGMPHLAGIMDNLGDDGNDNSKIDESLTRRVLLSIQSEIKRRLAIFKKWNLKPEIDGYTKLYRAGKVTEPMPHLIIISDEFAELRHEQPEFIDELVRVARIGRGPGVHLILATQKPAGVVTDQIWSNSKFKLCLRVQEKQDSMDMLKRGDAAFLTNAGRAYFQVGNNELFEQFQTGYSGAPYVERDNISEIGVSDATMITIDGVPAVDRLAMEADETQESISELDAAVKYITSVCRKNSIKKTRPMWLPPLPDHIYYENMNKTQTKPAHNSITAIYGLVDCPDIQEQHIAAVDLVDCSNLMIIMRQGMGKTTLIKTVLYSLATRYSSDDVNFYIFDFSSRTLKMFGILPHCGGVCMVDEAENIRKTFDLIEGIIEERKNVFSAAGVGSYREYVKLKKIPLVVFVIDNYFELANNYSDLNERMKNMIHNCTSYGVQVIIAASQVSDVNYRIVNNIGEFITGAFSERSDYRDVYSTSAQFVPAMKPGRGLIIDRGALQEFQAAIPLNCADESQLNEKLRQRFELISNNAKGHFRAQRIQVLPEDADYEEFLISNHDSKKMPIGYDKKDVSTVYADLNNIFCYSISYIRPKSIELIFKNMSLYAHSQDIRTYVIKLNGDIDLHDMKEKSMAEDLDSVHRMVDELLQEFHQRAIRKHQLIDEKADENITGKLIDEFGSIFVFIDDFGKLVSLLDSKQIAAGDKEDETAISQRKKRLDDLSGFFCNVFSNSRGMGIYFFAGFCCDVESTLFYTKMGRAFTEIHQGIHMGGCYNKQRFFRVDSSIISHSEQKKPEEYYEGYTETDQTGGIRVFIPHSRQEQE